LLSFIIPGRETFEIEHVVLDFNGTFACDGKILPGVRERLNALAEQVTVHIFTADTFGTAREACAGIRAQVVVTPQPVVAPAKEEYVVNLGAERTAAIGNGANDVLMLQRAKLAIVVLGPEGTALEALLAADVVVKEINDGLELLLNPKRLAATLRR